MEMAATSSFAPFPCCSREAKSLNSWWRRIRASPRAGIFCSSSIPDSRNKSWSDAGLARELQEFIAAAGLPSDKVPSMKELASSGRQDLANVVRRRGYKAIAELLATNPFATRTKAETESFTEESSSDVSHSTLVMNGSARPENEFSGQEASLDYLKHFTEPESDLAAKAEHFLRTGQLADTDDSDDESLYSSDDEDDGASELEHESSETMAMRKAALLRSKLLPFISSGETASAEAEVGEKLVAANKKVHELLQVEKQNDIQVQAKKSQFKSLSSSVHQKDKSLEPQSTTSPVEVVDPDDPITLLKLREKELALLARELEEAKAHLRLVQAKSTAELAQAKQISIEKDMRLSAAENALTNLKQVKIEWWGNASKVEIAGSFNGWQHFFVLEPDLSSEIRKPDGTRGSLMWETELWLYPGVYEMKFIVDGDWQVDHRREVMMKNMNQNNILRVHL